MTGEPPADPDSVAEVFDFDEEQPVTAEAIDETGLDAPVAERVDDRKPSRRRRRRRGRQGARASELAGMELMTEFDALVMPPSPAPLDELLGLGNAARAPVGGGRDEEERDAPSSEPLGQSESSESDDDLDSEEAPSGEADDRDAPPRRRRRRRGGRRNKDRGRPGRETAASGEPSANGDGDGDDVAEDDLPTDDASPYDMSDDHEDDDEDDALARHRHAHRDVTPWKEAIGYIVTANMESRSKNPGHGGRPRGRPGRRS